MKNAITMNACNIKHINNIKYENTTNNNNDDIHTNTNNDNNGNNNTTTKCAHDTTKIPQY